MPVVSAIELLRAEIESLGSKSRRVKSVLPFGIDQIDARLPAGGLALGALHEVAGGGNGAIDGAAAALFAAGIAARTKGKVLWCITRPDLFAPALAQAGLAPDRVLYVEAGDDKTVLACGRRPPTRWPWRRGSRNRKTIDDLFASPGTLRRGHGYRWLGATSVAAADGSGRLWTADSGNDTLAYLRTAIGAPTRPWCWSASLAC